MKRNARHRLRSPFLFDERRPECVSRTGVWHFLATPEMVKESLKYTVGILSVESPLNGKRINTKQTKPKKTTEVCCLFFFLFLLKWGKKYIRRRNGIKRHSWNICLRGVGYRTIFTVNVILILFKSLVGKLVWNFLKMNLWRISSLSYSSKKKLLFFFPLRFDCQVKRDQRQTIHPCFVVAVAVVAFFS